MTEPWRITYFGTQRETGLVLGRVATEAASPRLLPMHFGRTGVLLHGLSGRLASDVSRTGTGDTSRNSAAIPVPGLKLGGGGERGRRGQGERCVALGISRSDSLRRAVKYGAFERASDRRSRGHLCEYRRSSALDIYDSLSSDIN